MNKLCIKRQYFLIKTSENLLNYDKLFGSNRKSVSIKDLVLTMQFDFKYL